MPPSQCWGGPPGKGRWLGKGLLAGWQVRALFQALSQMTSWGLAELIGSCTWVLSAQFCADVRGSAVPRPGLFPGGVWRPS